MTHSWRALAKISRQFCTSCGFIALRGQSVPACRGERRMRLGSGYLAVNQLRQDWQENQTGYARYYGGGVRISNWVEECVF